MELDTIDIQILTELQNDGRLTNARLSEKVGLTPSPCLRRLKILERRKVIRGYRATLDRQRIGLALTVFVGIKVERHRDADANAFIRCIEGLPQIISCHLVSGEYDFLLQVVVPSLRDYDQFLEGVLLKMPSVRDIRSNFAIRTIKDDAKLPVATLLQKRSK